MFLVQIVCSDPECIEEREIALEDLAEVDDLACECSHGFVVLTVSELAGAARSGSVISLPERRRQVTRRAA
jgi:hypothetical protein